MVGEKLAIDQFQKMYAVDPGKTEFVAMLKSWSSQVSPYTALSMIRLLLVIIILLSSKIRHF